MLDKSSLNKAAQSTGASAPPPPSSSAQHQPLPTSKATTSSSSATGTTRTQGEKQPLTEGQKEKWSSERQRRDFLLTRTAFKEWYRHAGLFHRCSAPIYLFGALVEYVEGRDLRIKPFADQYRSCIVPCMFLVLLHAVMSLSLGVLLGLGAHMMSWTFLDGVAWLCTRASIVMIRAVAAAGGLVCWAVTVVLVGGCLWVPLYPVGNVLVMGVSQVKAVLPTSLFLSISGTLVISLLHLVLRLFFPSFFLTVSTSTLTLVYFLPTLLVVGDVWLEGLLRRVQIPVAVQHAVHGARQEGGSEEGEVERLRKRVEELEAEAKK